MKIRALCFALGTASAWPTESPHYPHYHGRQVFILNGSWAFAFLGQQDPAAWPLPEPDAWELVEVPDAFDLRPNDPNCDCWPAREQCERCCDRSLGHRGDPECWGDRRYLDGVWIYEQGPHWQGFEACCRPDPLRLRRGTALYQTEVEAPPNTAAILQLAACTNRCLVRVDGELLADHAGLSPLEVEVPPSVEGRRRILVIADNTFNMTTHPVHQPKYDWYQAGGLIRSVQFHVLRGPEPLYIASVGIWPRSEAEVDVELQASPAAAKQTDLVFRFHFDDDSRCKEAASWELLAGATMRLRVPEASVWHTTTPSLHRLSVALFREEEMLDCHCARFGLRTVGTRGDQLLLNGSPLKLLGFNRHDMVDSPVVTYDQLVTDVLLLKDLGANFIRGAHYPQDQRFLDLCDEQGLLVWEEVLGWQNTVSDFSDPTFMAQSLRMAEEMARASANHPSVIFYGFFNEGESFDEGEATTWAYESMAAQLRRHSGRSRLISYGSNHAGEDQQLGSVDVYAFHLYLAWYPTTRPVDKQEVDEIPSVWEQVRLWALQAGEKPMLVTEAGAGGVFGFRGPVVQKWTEEYQALVLGAHLSSVTTNPHIAGISLWQFADILVDRSVSDEQHRPRGLNNKGVFSLYRSPKLGAAAVKSVLQRAEGTE
ncbi:GUSB [Symbiodinium sp. CCMP2456]|nr:GUSB [Symbiodinium sp. CCMP2456]